MGQDLPRARRGRPPNDADAPRGPDEVVAAVVAAAVDELATGGIAGVTVRQIAARAGVNPGLVHRYIGSKVDLVRRAVAAAGHDLDRHLDDDRSGPNDQVLGQVTAPESLVRYEQLLAHLALEDQDLDGLDLGSQLWAETAGDTDRALDRTARLQAVSMVALDLGWRLFQPLVSTATRLDPGQEAQVWDHLPAVQAALSTQP